MEEKWIKGLKIKFVTREELETNQIRLLLEYRLAQSV